MLKSSFRADILAAIAAHETTRSTRARIRLSVISFFAFFFWWFFPSPPPWPSPPPQSVHRENFPRDVRCQQFALILKLRFRRPLSSVYHHKLWSRPRQLAIFRIARSSRVFAPCASVLATRFLPVRFRGAFVSSRSNLPQ